MCPLEICKEIRKDIITMTHNGKGGHIGSSLSIVEILYTLYFNIMNIDPKNIHDINRDRLILSTGQGAIALYSVMQRKGFFPKSWIDNFLKKECPLTTFPSIQLIPGVE